MNVLVYGSGQLARMMYLAGSPLNINVQAVDVASNKIVNPVTKRNLKLSLDTAIENADVLTVEFEHVPESLLEQAEQSGKLLPNMRSILVGADRVREKHLLALAGIPNCEHEIITDIAQLSGITDRLGDKIIFKSSRDGYDGYGQWRISNADGLTDLAEVFSNLDLVKVPIVAETMCPFDRELSLVGTIGKDGNIALYPLAQNTHFEGQLHVSIAP
ncbi:MAG: ATP-grasp domain-containing protein, partial [Glaciecola sp.]|nr:ATP-grasp domain-containing protein [Glaciecola sp.]